MASRAELMFVRAMEALTKLDAEIAQQVMSSDDKVDQIDLRIESKCLTLLSQSHSEGSDLRILGTTLKMITDIERVADLAVDLARCAIKIDRELGASSHVDLPKIAELARGMFHAAMESYVRQDGGAQIRVAEAENEVDALFREIRDQIHHLMRLHPDEVVTLSYLLIALHDIERVADHALNIAERVSYMFAREAEAS